MSYNWRMRKIVVLTFLTLDGVMQAPGGPDEEDTSGGFLNTADGASPYFDEPLGKTMGDQMAEPFDLLLGRRTYEIFASHWPQQDENTNPAAALINNAEKYIVSSKEMKLTWKKSNLIVNKDMAGELRKLKAEDGPMLQVHGSSNLIQTLLKNDLVDELWLKIFPITLGTGKRLFGEGTVPAAFELSKCESSPSGVIIANYKRAGDIKTGSFAD